MILWICERHLGKKKKEYVKGIWPEKKKNKKKTKKKKQIKLMVLTIIYNVSTWIFLASQPLGNIDDVVSLANQNQSYKRVRYITEKKEKDRFQCLSRHCWMALRREWLGTRRWCSSLSFVVGEVSWPLSSHFLKASAS